MLLPNDDLVNLYEREEKEWVYIIVSFSLMKPVQSFAESKDTESQLNYNFQMAQLTSGQPPTPTPKIEDKKVDIVPPVV